jgi:ribonuclease BN (tRNA processing enzyme)
MAYLSDHEPALGVEGFPIGPAWTSGHDLAAGVDVLVHDGQFSDAERQARVGWGHSSTVEAARFAHQAGAKRLVCFHHDPSHDDEAVDRLVETAAGAAPDVLVSGAREGVSLQV